MARFRRRSGAFSLFAFQDIITSVTAIMILIVLILTLEVVMRSRKAAVAEDHQAVVQDLQAAIARLESQIEATREQVAQARRVAETVIGVDAPELANRVARERNRDRAAAAALQAVEARVVAAEQERRELDALGADEARRERVRLEAEVVRLNGLIGTIEQECRGLASRQASVAGEDPAVVLAALEFNPSESRKRPVITEVTGTGVSVADGIGEPLRPLGWGSFGPPLAFGTWLRSLDAAAESVVVIVRPSGVDRYDAVREAVVRAGLDVGTELVGEATRLLSARGGSP